jgi:hypothetical protein
MTMPDGVWYYYKGTWVLKPFDEITDEVLQSFTAEHPLYLDCMDADPASLLDSLVRIDADPVLIAAAEVAVSVIVKEPPIKIDPWVIDPGVEATP